MSYHNELKSSSDIYIYIYISLALCSVSILSALILASSTTSADVVDDVTIIVPVSCNMTSELDEAHTATINPGQYQSDIGTTNFTVFCNDNSGYAIYAIGYSNEEYGNTKMLATINSQLDPTYDINTGTNTSGANSSWSMKLIPVTSAIAGSTQPYVPTIENGFANYHIVPEEYTKVATFASNTDFTIGSSLQSTYQVYIDGNKPAGTYAGKVKYTLVHPASMPIPKSTMLDTGKVVAAKMKTLATGTETAYNARTSDIKAIRMADSLPDGFVASDANTVSTSDSRHPIYIFFDNTNDAGIMYFYTGGYQVVMNNDSSALFVRNLALADISGLADWDTSNVINMNGMFADVAALTNVNSLSSWDTSNVEDISGLFCLNTNTYQLGYSSHLTDISALANWDTSKVTNMLQTFANATSLSDISALAFWNTSNVTNMRFTFASTPITNVDALSSWDVSKVETMHGMFAVEQHLYEDYSVRSQLTDISGLSNWNTKSATDMSSMFATANITNLNALSNWNVSNVSDMKNMFQGTSNLTDATAIAGWDVTGVTATAGSSTSSTNNFYQMFYNSAATKVPFTLRSGTWNSDGTYIPSE